MEEPPTEVQDEDVSLDFVNIEEPTSFEEYASCDCDNQCAPMISTEEIIMSVEPSCTGDDEDDDYGDPLLKVSIQQASSAFRHLQAFLLQHTTNASNTYRLLTELERDLLQSSNNASTQTRITDFFQKIA